MTIKMGHTNRGFVHGAFTDIYGKPCSIQNSSYGKDASWLGLDKGTHDPISVECSARMHLDQALVQELLPLLEHFAAHGVLPPPPPDLPDYSQAVIANNDVLLISLRHEVEKAGSQRNWAREHNVSEAHLSDVLLGRCQPGPLIARALGFEPAWIYAPNSEQK